MASPADELRSSQDFNLVEYNQEQRQPDSDPIATNTMATDIVKPEGRKGDNPASAVVWAAYFVFALVAWATLLGSNPSSLGWFRFHVPLQTLAIGAFIYGIMTLQPTSQPHTKAAGLRRHQTAAIGVGVPLILLGTLAIFANKHDHGSAHFSSWHGTFGILAVAWIVVQALIGGSTVWFDGAAWGGGMKAKMMWKYHRLSGYLLFPLLLFTAFLGGWSRWATVHTHPFVQLLAYFVAPLLMLAGVYTRVRVSKMKFF